MLDHHRNRIVRDLLYDKKCPRCCMVIKLEDDECRTCTDLENPDLIRLHIQQTDAYYERKKLGVIFIAVSVFILAVGLLLVF